MNNSELINYKSQALNEALKEYAWKVESYGAKDPKIYGTSKALYEGYVEAIGEIKDILTHTRIRNTATEPPTREDCDFADDILAYSKLYGWMTLDFHDAIAFPLTYTRWTQLPESGTPQ